MSKYNIIAETDEMTVVSEYIPEKNKNKEYQTEAQLELSFIQQLQSQGYSYDENFKINNAQKLKDNLRTQLTKLNDYDFSDYEWERFYELVLNNPNENVMLKTKTIQEEHQKTFRTADGEVKNIILIDKKNIHNNYLQVINQYRDSDSRYDVTILVNGLPLVHIELKRRGVEIKQAFNQIKSYQREDFNSLFEYVQIFVISNGTDTKYFSNTTRQQHLDNIKNKKNTKKTSHSFEFTSNWAAANNKKISDLIDFTKTFFAKHTLLNILTKYCVFTSEQMLLVMRPYQIVATEKILTKINIALNNNNLIGKKEAGGYIWHTTGSGKTLTSFKTAQLATDLKEVNKVIFVVDRKDLDYQTIKEYDRFQKGAASGNNSTKVLEKQLMSQEDKIIVTTIQKLSIFVNKNRGHEIYSKNVVLIFDECHRSQFGDMHRDIIKNFKKYILFGFTGTPIFDKDKNDELNLKTTAAVFGECLHKYTIVDAINDGNVLKFKIDYVKTLDTIESLEEAYFNAPNRIEKVVEYILLNFNKKTYRIYSDSSYYHKVIANVEEQATHNKNKEIKKERKLTGFNSILATNSIKSAKLYYKEFKRQITTSDRNLKVAIIFSHPTNSDEDLDTSNLDSHSIDFLNEAITDYNQMFEVNYDASINKFENYYKDVSMRLKNRELDLLIVVSMFLTGFDATTLNTLWVDKNLKEHNLIQAFSRTNRILNSVKSFGNIVCFRNLEKATEEALSMFGNKDQNIREIVLLKPYAEYYNIYSDLIENLTTKYPIKEDIVSETAQKEFIKVYNEILRLRNVLLSFDEFANNVKLSEFDFQEYQGKYFTIRDKLIKSTPTGKEIDVEGIVFEIELIKQVEVNIDYILQVIDKYNKNRNKFGIAEINRAIDSSSNFRNKKELFNEFATKINIDSDVITEWSKFFKDKKERELQAIIEAENLKEDETKKFMRNAFLVGEMKDRGTEFDSLLPPISRLNKNREARKQTVINKLLDFFIKFCD